MVTAYQNNIDLTGKIKFTEIMELLIVALGILKQN